MTPQGPPGIHRIPLTVAVLAVLFFLSLAGLSPPAPKPTNAPATQFSGGRAHEMLRQLVGDGVPHPTGSSANDEVRLRVIKELSKLGYKPEVQTGFSCDEYGTCGSVKNVVALLDGAEPGSAILLAAHYDSVPAGPGASDDGAGTAAVLEIARTLKSLPTPRHPVILLIDDGEEAGLLGARVFVDQHPSAREVRAVVNVDSRGTSGPSLMFETGTANQWLRRLFAQHLPRPATSSIFDAAYKQLPNDTDFRVFKAAGYQGFNFANIGDVSQYHTPLDNFENASPATLQHHGDNALPAILALANADLSKLPLSEAVFFDLFERWTIWWPANWTLTIAFAAGVLLLLEIGWLVQIRRLNPVAYLWGLVGWPSVVLATTVGALLFGYLMRKAGTMPINWVAHPLPLQIAFWSLALAVVSSVALALSSRAGFWGLWASTWTWWGLLAIVIGWQNTGISYLFAIPLCVAVLAAVPSIIRRGESASASTLAAILPLAASGLVSFGPLLILYDGLGNRVLPGIAILVALILTPISPLAADLEEERGLSRLACASVPIAITILAAFAAMAVPAYSTKSPEHVNLRYWQNGDSGKAQWTVNTESARLPEPIRLAASFQRSEKGPFPWSSGSAFLADAPALDRPAPTFTILEVSESGDRREYRTLLRSERNAPVAMVFFPPDTDLQSVRVEGQPVQPEIERIRRYLNGWVVYACLTMPAKGVEISFTLPKGKPVEVYAVDQTYGLPTEGTFLLKARPLAATPYQDGDTAVVSRRVQLLP